MAISHFNTENTTHDADYQDFVGNNIINFDTINMEKINTFTHMLSFARYDQILEDIFQKNVDEFSYYAVFAFSKKLISREQVASMLDYREMIVNFSFENVQIYPLLDQNKTYSKEVLSIISNFISENDQKSFLKKLEKKPHSEQCFFTFKLSNTYLNDHPDIKKFLMLANKEKIISTSNQSIGSRISPIYQRIASDKKEEIIQKIISLTNQQVMNCYIHRDDQKILNEKLTTLKHQIKDLKLKLKELEATSSTDDLYVSVFSMGGKDALNHTLYKRNAKAILHRIGIFQINDIKYSMEKFGRYRMLSFPGITNASSFHGIQSNPVFIGLHDDFHARIISSIPNEAYRALFHAINLVIKHSIPWSKDIWDATDAEIGLFLENPQPQSHPTSKTITKWFQCLLNADVYTQHRPIGLFSGSPYFDTTWLLLIDIVLNKKTWFNLFIDPIYFEGKHQKMYAFALKNIEHINNNNSYAHKVAFLKTAYFHLSIENLENYKFVKKEKYLQLINTTNLESLFIDKKTVLQNYEQYHYYEKLFRNKNLLIEDLQNMEFKNYLDEPIIKVLLINNHLTITELKELSPKQIQRLTNSVPIYHLIYKNKLTINQFKEFTINQIDIITNHANIYFLLESAKISISEFKTCSHYPILIELLNHEFYHHAKQGKLALQALIAEISKNEKLLHNIKVHPEKYLSLFTIKSNSSKSLSTLSLFRIQTNELPDEANKLMLNKP